MDLLEVFGGQDNLRLMCGATRFRKEARNRISFRVDKYLVSLVIAEGVSVYVLKIFDEISGVTVGHACAAFPDRVRYYFEHHTGYSLSF
jgi:hypothetical protein